MRVTSRIVIGLVAAFLTLSPETGVEVWPCQPLPCEPFNQDLPWDDSGGAGCRTCVTVVRPDGSGYEQCEHPHVGGRYRKECRINDDGTCTLYGDLCIVQDA